MKKSYLNFICCLFIMYSLNGQDNQYLKQSYNSLPKETEKLIPVHAGDIFLLRSSEISTRKRTLFSNILRFAGISIATYQTSRVFHNQKYDVSEGKNNLLIPLGLGVVVSADKIAGNKKEPTRHIGYNLYDKNKKLLISTLIKLDKRRIIKNEGIVFRGKAKENGFIKLILYNKTANDIPITGFVLNLSSDSDGYDSDGYDKDGYNRDGYNRDGYDKDGYDKDGYDKSGYDKDGYDKSGYDKSGYDKDGYDKDGYDKSGYDKDGYDKDGYDKDGYDREGYDKDGYDRDGYDRDGYRRDS